MIENVTPASVRRCEAQVLDPTFEIDLSHFVKNRYLPLTPCSSRTRPSYVLDTSWSEFYRESEVIFLIPS